MEKQRKDFIFCHPTADLEVSATAIIRGGFEYQGQKCSAASRIYLPKSISKKLISNVIDQVKTIKMGSPIDFNNFMTAVIMTKPLKEFQIILNMQNQVMIVKFFAVVVMMILLDIL